MKKDTIVSTKMIKAILIILITISYIIVAAIFGIYEMGPIQFRTNWIGGTTKNGAAGEIVYFNYSVEVRGGRIAFHFEIRDLENIWGAQAIPNKIDIYPGETRVLSIQVNIPEDTEVGDTNEIPFTLYGGLYIHGNIKNPVQASVFLNLRVIEESIPNETDSNEEWIDDLWGRVHYLDMEGVLIHLYLLIFTQVFILYIIPELKKFKRNRE